MVEHMNLKELKITDISMPISESMKVYKGKEEKRPKLVVQSDFSTGSAFESQIIMNMHTGTHLDRGLHMIPDGTTVESLNLENVICPCKVLDLTNVASAITEADLSNKKISPGDFILLKTRNSTEDILEGEYVFLEKSGAEFLQKKSIRGVGIDGLGIERSQPGHETHLTLLSSEIVILEGLRLENVSEGEYFLFAAPILIVGAEAAPIRAVLVEGLL